MSKNKLKPTLTKEAFLKPLIETVIEEVLEAEMKAALQAEKGERSEQRLGYRSGYYSRGLITRVGKIELQGAAGSSGALFEGSV